MSGGPGIAVIGTLDTKGAEFGYLIELLRAHGVEPIVVNTGIMQETTVPTHIGAREVASRGGSSLDALRAKGSRSTAVEVMSRGVAVVVRELYDQGIINGAINIGGGQGSTIAAAAMHALPVGVPKLIVSTIAGVEGASTALIGTRDTILVNSVVDISGLNSLSRTIIANAAGAVAGAVLRPRDAQENKTTLRVAETMFGVTSACVNEVRHLLEAAGLDVVVFAATGAGDRAMDDMIDDGQIDGVVDVTISQFGQGLLRGDDAGGAHRLAVAGDAGIPQVVSFGGVDIIVCPTEDRFVREAREGLRRSTMHSMTMTVVRPTVDESTWIGGQIAERLNTARGPLCVMIPLRGFSEYSEVGGPLHDPEADAALLEAFRAAIDPSVEVHELDMAINDPAFAAELAQAFLRIAQLPAHTERIESIP